MVYDDRKKTGTAHIIKWSLKSSSSFNVTICIIAFHTVNVKFCNHPIVSVLTVSLRFNNELIEYELSFFKEIGIRAMIHKTLIQKNNFCNT